MIDAKMSMIFSCCAVPLCGSPWSDRSFHASRRHHFDTFSTDQGINVFERGEGGSGSG